MLCPFDVSFPCPNEIPMYIHMYMYIPKHTEQFTYEYASYTTSASLHLQKPLRAAVHPVLSAHRKHAFTHQSYTLYTYYTIIGHNNSDSVR